MSATPQPQTEKPSPDEQSPPALPQPKELPPEERIAPPSSAQPPSVATEQEALILRRRAWAGISIGGLGIAFVAVVAWWSLHHLHKSVGSIQSRDAAIVHIAQLIAQSAVAVAVVFFAYQLLRAAERLLLPHWLLRRDHVDLLKLMLGVDTPADGAVKVAQAFQRTAEVLSKGDDK